MSGSGDPNTLEDTSVSRILALAYAGVTEQVIYKNLRLSERFSSISSGMSRHLLPPLVEAVFYPSTMYRIEWQIDCDPRILPY